MSDGKWVRVEGGLAGLGTAWRASQDVPEIEARREAETLRLETAGQERQRRRERARARAQAREGSS